MSSKYTILETAAIEKLCSLIRESHSVADAINDSGTLATNQTYSNFKINELLTEIETSISDVSNKVDGLEFIDDLATSTDKAYSSDKTKGLIDNPYEYVADTDTYGADILQFPLGHYKIGNNSTITDFINTPVAITGLLDVLSPASGANNSPFESAYGYRCYRYTVYNGGGVYERFLESGATAGIRTDTGWKKVAYNGDVLSLNGIDLNSGTRISIPSSENGVGTLIDGSYITIDNANTSKSSTITADGIDTPSLIVGGKDVLTKSGGEMNANANLKFKGSNDNAYTEIYENGVDIYDNSGNSTFVASDIIETPEVKTKKISMENGTISMPSTGLGASIGIKDDYLTASLYADGLYIEDSDEHTSTHVGAGGISTPSLTVGGKDVIHTGDNVENATVKMYGDGALNTSIILTNTENTAQQTYIFPAEIDTPNLLVGGKKVIAPKYEYLKFTTDNSSITIGEIALFIADMGDFLIVNIGGTCEVTEAKTVLTLPHTTYTNKNYNTANGQLISISGSSSTDITLASFYVNESGVGLRLNNTATDAIRVWGTVTLYKK